MILLTGCRTQPVTIKDPIDFYIINQGLYEARVGKKNFNIRDTHTSVGEWVGNERIFVPLNQIPNLLACYPLKIWLEKIKPKLKEGARQYRDSQD